MSYERMFFKQSFSHELASGHILQYQAGRFYNVDDEHYSAILPDVAETEAEHEARLAQEAFAQVVPPEVEQESDGLPPGWPRPLPQAVSGDPMPPRSHVVSGDPMPPRHGEE